MTARCRRYLALHTRLGDRALTPAQRAEIVEQMDLLFEAMGFDEAATAALVRLERAEREADRALAEARRPLLVGLAGGGRPDADQRPPVALTVIRGGRAKGRAAA